jgi:Tfp pilus assembly protein PilO
MAFEQSTRRYGRFYRDARKYASKKEVLISSYLILSLFTVSFFAAVFIKPTAVTIAKLWKEIQDKKDVYSRLQKKIGELEQAQKLYTEVEDNLDLLNNAIPKTVSFSKLVQQIEYLADLHEVQLSNARYGAMEIYTAETATPAASELLEYPINLNATGSFTNIKYFLKDLERFERIMTVQLVRMSPIQDREGLGKARLAIFLDGKTYSFSEGLDIQSK